MFAKRSTHAVGMVLLAGSLVLGMTACGGSDSDSIKVGLITKTDSNPFFVKLREAAQAQADKDGAELIALAGAFDGDNEGQVAAIENMVGQGVKGILITPNSSTGVLDAIKKARDAGVVVIALDTATDPEDAVDATFATDNLAAGVSQGKWVKAALGNVPAQIVMRAEDLVDAALQGFERGESVTLPALHDDALWDAFEGARKAMAPHLSSNEAASRYQPLR